MHTNSYPQVLACEFSYMRYIKHMTDKKYATEFAKKGHQAMIKKYSPEQRREWAKKGGRPVNKINSAVNSINKTMTNKIIAGSVIALAFLVSASTASAFTGNNDGPSYFVENGHRYFGAHDTVNLVGKVFPEMAIHYTYQKTICRIFGNTCSLNMVGKIPTAADIAAIKVYRCTKKYPGAVIVE